MKRALNALALSAALTVPAVGMAGGLAAESGQWRSVLVQRLSPEFAHPLPAASEPLRPLKLDQRWLWPEYAQAWMAAAEPTATPSTALRIQWWQIEAGANGEGRALAQWPEPTRFEQSLLMPGFTRDLTNSSSVTVSAMLASQRFANANMNLLQQDGPLASVDRFSQGASQGPEEVAHGLGLRVAWLTQPAQRLTVETALQSRVNMTEFATVRGLHGSLAQLDMPSRAELNLSLQTTPRLALSAGVSRIFYNEVGAFPSRALPARFGALLGDSSSPDFDWDDLTVLRLGWQWQPGDNTRLFMDYRTRSQPRPRDPALAQALASELAQNAFTLGVVQELTALGFGRRSQLRLSGAYAPPEFAFGGNVMGVVSDRLNQSLEVQVLLKTDF